MSEENPPMNALIKINVSGDLTKPATTLIEKCSDAIGGAFQPLMIVRNAKAEAKAKKILLEGEFELEEIARRAERRRLSEACREQQNMEDTLAAAIPLLKNDAQPNEMEEDWIAYFLNQVRLISDERVQRVWSHLLAEEANSPRTFSRITINTLALMNRNDALSFQSICDFIVVQDEILMPLIFIKHRKFYDKFDISHANFKHLDDLGLISYKNPGKYLSGKLRSGEQIFFGYHGRKLSIGIRNHEHSKSTREWEINFSRIDLTRAGLELASLCHNQEVEGLLEFYKDHFEDGGYEVKITDIDT